MPLLILRWCRLWKWAFLLLLAAFAGCGPRGPKVVQVSGTVTRGGQPVANLFLNFMPAEGRPSWGMTDEEGNYTLHYDNRQDGAITGTHTVFVVFKPRDVKEEMAMLSGKLKLSPAQSAILEKYGKPETTPLQFEVKEDGQVIDIRLD